MAITTRATDPGGVPESAFGPRRESELGLGWARDTFALKWPRRGGLRIVARAALAGGPLGGSVKLFETRAGLMTEVPLTERTALTFRAAGAWITGWGKTETIPYDRRYGVGGPHEIRGFEPRSVGPRDAQGRLVGGSSQLLGGAEYIVDVASRVQILGFVDSGQAFGEGASFRLDRLRVSTGVEIRVRLPLLSVPLRLLYAATVRRDPVHGQGGFGVALGLPTVP
jgi:outer membrane protein assembly factor BamA